MTGFRGGFFVRSILEKIRSTRSALSASVRSFPYIVPKKAAADIRCKPTFLAGQAAVPSSHFKLPPLPPRTKPTRILNRSFFPTMLPERAILVWKDPDVMGPMTKTDNDRHRCMSILFEVNVNGVRRRISLRRPIDEPFSSLREKVIHKINKECQKELKTKRQLQAYRHENEFVHIVFRPAGMSDQEADALLVEDALGCKRFVVGSEEVRVIQDAPDAASVFISTVPLVGCPVIATVDYRENGCFDVNSFLPTFHWFVMDGPSSHLDETSISLDDVSARSFSIKGCEFRATSAIYKPAIEDVGKYLVVVCDLGTDSIVRASVSRKKVSFVGESLLFEERLAGLLSFTRFRIVSFNILADLYLNLAGKQEELFFPYCPKEYQQHEYRYPLLLSELEAYNADLIFLQEVDFRFQFRFLSVFAKERSYDFRFLKKDRQVNEGSAILFRRDIFREVSVVGFILADLLHEDSNSDVRCILETSESSYKLFMERPTVLQVLILHCELTDRVVVCANTHLHHSPAHEHIKAVQSLVCVRKLAAICSELEEEGREVKLMFAGDFNSTPTADGPVYTLLSTGKLGKEHPCWKLDEELKPVDIQLCSRWPSGLENLSGSPEYTNFTRYMDEIGGLQGFAGCLDYVWAEPLKGEPVEGAPPRARVLPSPSYSTVTRHRALPAKHSPSDHVAIVLDVDL